MIINYNIKTRFAPSPTGFIHIGNIRTALFSWLYAKKMNGKFLIRIDDTDTNRTLQKYTNNILDTLNWLNLKSDEKIFFQSQNHKKYEIILKKLIKENKAYKCFCQKNRLEQIKLNQLAKKKNIKYDGFCKRNKNIKNTSDFIIRFNNPKYGYIEFFDQVKGKIKISNTEIDDFIIAKKNYMPTYNFASTIDDIQMNITDIIRGEDHIPNTPKQINIIKALNKNIPRFIHLPMILNEKKKKLSKRNKETNINLYKKNGFLPEALLNYIVRLGWSHKNKEIFSLNEMINFFNIKNINTSSSIINTKKLIWLNKHYIKNNNIEKIKKHMINIEKKFTLNYNLGPNIKTLIEFNKNRVNTLKEIITDNIFLYKKNINIEDDLLKLYFSKKIINIISNFYKELKKTTYDWNLNNIKTSITNLTIKYKINLSEIAIPLRILITGKNKPKPLYEIIFLSGRILILKKIINIIKKMGL